MSQIKSLIVTDILSTHFLLTMYFFMVDFLAVADNRLTGTVPRDLALISTLELLELSSNDLTGTMPPEICERRNDGLDVLTVDCSEVSCTCCDAC